jgi:uncharacterized protein (TIGR03067 family)
VSAPESESEINAFVGRWSAVSGKLGASTIPLPDTTFEVKTDGYTVRAAGNQDAGKLKWRQIGDLQAVDLIGTAGAHAGKTIEAIVRVRGDVMQLCYAVDGTGRPRTFDIAGGTAVVTVRYRRVG